jgi:hypothetical protein
MPQQHQQPHNDQIEQQGSRGMTSGSPGDLDQRGGKVIGRGFFFFQPANFLSQFLTQGLEFAFVFLKSSNGVFPKNSRHRGDLELYPNKLILKMRTGHCVPSGTGRRRTLRMSLWGFRGMGATAFLLNRDAGFRGDRSGHGIGRSPTRSCIAARKEKDDANQSTKDPNDIKPLTHRISSL